MKKYAVSCLIVVLAWAGAARSADGPPVRVVSPDGRVRIEVGHERRIFCPTASTQYSFKRPQESHSPTVPQTQMIISFLSPFILSILTFPTKVRTALEGRPT